MLFQNSQFFRKYELESEKPLGDGTFSVCMRCMDKTSRLRYAVKIVYSKHDISQEEGALRACQGHQNIVNMREVIRDEQYTYLVMELLTGGELFDRIREFRRFTEKEAVLFFKQIVQAVHFMHTKNIAHRDLKAENIIFTSRNSTELKLVDFGFAKQNSNSGMTTPCFTLDYAAPEVLCNNALLTGEPYTEASDLWSLGVILYTMLCGQTPFTPKAQGLAQSSPETRIRSLMQRIKAGAMETDINEWQSVSDSGKKLVCSLLTVDPRKRLTMSRLLRHEWLQSSPTARDLRHVPLLANRGEVQCCMKDSCRAFEYCLRDEISASRKMEPLPISVDDNSSDVEIVAEYNERGQFKLQKSLLGDALEKQQAQQVALVEVKDEVKVTLDVKEEMEIDQMALSEQTPEVHNKSEEELEQQQQETKINATTNGPVDQDTVNSQPIDQTRKEDDLLATRLGIPSADEEVSKIRELGWHQQHSENSHGLCYFEKHEGSVGRKFPVVEDVFFRGFSDEEVQEALQRTLLWKRHVTLGNAPVSRSSGGRSTRTRKKSVGSDETVVEELMRRHKEEFERRKSASRTAVTAAMNSGPKERPNKRKINWFLFAERRDMPSRMSKRLRASEHAGTSS